jgi:hypothetical protein
VVFESGCRLERIDQWAFHGNGLKSIDIDIADTFAFIDHSDVDRTHMAKEEAQEEVLTMLNLHFREID